MPRRSRAIAIALVSLFTLSACGGGSETTKTSSPSNGSPTTPTTPPSTTPTTPVPLGVPANFKVQGSIGPATAVNGARVYAVDAYGKYCGRADVDGKPNSDTSPSVAFADATGIFQYSGKCQFPVVLFADLPDANDVIPLPVDALGEGPKYYGFISEIFKQGDQFKLNLSPATSALTMLVSAKLPGLAVANPKTVLNDSRLSQAKQHIDRVLSRLAPSVGYTGTDFIGADVSPGSPLAKLLSFIQVSVERVTSTGQTIVRFHLPSEHRPLALVATDGNPLSEAAFDPGLGVTLDDVDLTRLQSAFASQKEIDSFLSSGDPLNPLNYDTCFLHNGSKLPKSLFDVRGGWLPAFTASAENVTLLRLDTYTDFANETLETRNEVPDSTLAFVSFDFRNKYGMKQRAYTWLIKGARSIQGCSSSGSNWRILGNQRSIYVKGDTIAVHETLHNQQFASRRDTYGSGLEFFIFQPTQQYTHVLISGPGLPDNGVVFMRAGNTFLYSTMTLLSLRQLSNSGLPESSIWESIVQKVQDTRAVMLTDLQIRRLTDDYFDLRNNAFTYRFFKALGDLYPTLTWTETLPKRPYLSTERSVDFFPSLGLNLDNLVQSLQLSEPVVVNWSIPLDLRKKPMLPEQVWVSRFNCVNPKQWPSCGNRIDQYNEYDLALTPLWDPMASSAVLVPEPLPIPDLRTFLGYVRLRQLDSLNRPLETRVGMDYRR